MIPVLKSNRGPDRQRIDQLLRDLRLDAADLALGQGHRGRDAAAVQAILADVARRGDDALVEISKRFDDPGFSADQIRVRPDEMKQAAGRVPDELMSALGRSISQVREYQQHIRPADPSPLRRPGVELGLRFTPLDSAGLYFPGGKASYPSSLIMLAVPAQVAGVSRIVVCTPPSRFGRSDLVLAACHELKLTDVYRAGGAAAIAAMAFGTSTIPAVDKIVGPGNAYVQLAKRALAGCVGIDGFLGPSEIVTLADQTGRPDFIAADLIAQAEHDPGSCFLLTDSATLADAVLEELRRQTAQRQRKEAILKALADRSAIIIGDSMEELVDLANRFAAEHVNIQTADDDAVVKKLRHAGAIFAGPWSPVAAGDYVAGPSHCLPTNTTARFSSGVSVYEFMKRASVERYTAQGLSADASAIEQLALAEGLDGHAASVRVRFEK
jgi:histidinol dehydrogenase